MESYYNYWEKTSLLYSPQLQRQHETARCHLLRGETVASKESEIKLKNIFRVISTNNENLRYENNIYNNNPNIIASHQLLRFSSSVLCWVSEDRREVEYHHCDFIKI